MESLRKDPSPLESVLSRVRRKEESPWGKLQRACHRWLTVLETNAWLPRPALLFRPASADAFLPRRSAIDLDSLLILSGILHLLLFFLVSRAALLPVSGEHLMPIKVRIIEPGPSSDRREERIPLRKPAGGSRVRTANIPAASDPEREEKAPPVEAPPLPGPKALTDIPPHEALDFSRRPVEELLRLPGRSPALGHAPVDAAAVKPSPSGALSAGDSVPERLRNGSDATAAADRRSTNSTASPAMTRADFGPYLDMIRKRVQSVWKYPGGISGSHQVNVVFVIDRSGNLGQARVLDSTNQSLNESALQAMKLASPFPPIPESLKELAGTPVRVRFHVDFGINAGRP
jgi:TonB family protein